ncbi:MAG: DUF4124 domain-containing protein [Spongiibacteraceae bacterium]
MLARVYLVVALFVAMPLISHAEVYKIVDSQGRVSYTNQKPMTAERVKAEAVEINEGYSNKIKVTKTGSVSYCGSIALPTRDVGSTNFYGTIVNYERQWKNEIDRISKMMNQYNRYGRPESTTYNNDNLTKLAENQCAYDWVQAQRKIAAEERLILERKSEGLNTYLGEMLSAQESVCGKEPIYSALDRFFDEKRKSWQRCVSDYQGKMRDIESDLKKTDQQLADIHKIEQKN